MDVVSNKIKITAYCDSPTCATGFGTVSRNIFEGLYKTGRYEINIMGINYQGEPHNFPYKIWPAAVNMEGDPYGRQKAVSFILNHPMMSDYDILFVLQDSFIIDFLPTLLPHARMNRDKPFKSICYYPVDAVLKKDWSVNIDCVDKLVCYSEFGKQESLKPLPHRSDIEVIPHGVNTNEFFPMSKGEVQGFKDHYFGSQADKFIITNLNRNQQRKDIPRTLMAYKKFKEVVPDSLLYLHMAPKDQGWDLVKVCVELGLNPSKDVAFPQNFNVNHGYSRDVVNALYNSSDAIISTTLGEGFGLSWLEAMAARRPVIMPDNTAMSEFITEDIGYLAKSGSNSSLWTVLHNDNEVLRPLVDVDDLVEKLTRIYYNREEADKKADNAYKWVKNNMDWQRSIMPMWVRLFDSVYTELINPEPENKETENSDRMLSADVI